MNIFQNKTFSKLIIILLSIAVLPISNAMAGLGHPEPYQTLFQEPATEIMQRIEWLHNKVMLSMCFGIVAFVLLLLIYTCFRFRRSANPNPSKTSHNTFVEIVWTVIPVLILVGIAIPSFRLLYFENVIPESPTEISVVNGVVNINGENNKDAKIVLNGNDITDGILVKEGKPVFQNSVLNGNTIRPAVEGEEALGDSAELLVNGKPYVETLTLKIIGYQWYWGYEYPENKISFESVISKEAPKEGEFRLLEVDNPLVLPINTNIRIQTTGADVIHSWAIPSFGVKVDAVPGRLNEGWFNITKAGTFYGQCSELCGKDHGFMPIKIKAVTKAEFKKWLEEAKVKFAENSINQNVASK